MTHKILDTIKYDVQSVKCNKRKRFIKDFHKFISDTKIELMLYFDGFMSDDAKQVQSLMKILFDKGLMELFNVVMESIIVMYLN